MRVSTGASVPMFALSNVVGITSMSGENVLLHFITRLITLSLVASVKSHNGSSMTQSVKDTYEDMHEHKSRLMYELLAISQLEWSYVKDPH